MFCQIQLERELKSVVYLLSLESVVVKVESVKRESEDWRRKADFLSHDCILLFVAN